ncbi:Uncharacterised protein [Vibrio cholerae]|nr:Uncharacterised protein [Vibrio cholerae]
MFTQFACKQQAIFSWQVDVHNHQVNWIIGQHLVHLFTIAGLKNSVSLCFKNTLKSVTSYLLVFDDKDLRGLH